MRFVGVSSIQPLGKGYLRTPEGRMRGHADDAGQGPATTVKTGEIA